MLVSTLIEVITHTFPVYVFFLQIIIWKKIGKNSHFYGASQFISDQTNWSF